MRTARVAALPLLLVLGLRVALLATSPPSTADGVQYFRLAHNLRYHGTLSNARAWETERPPSYARNPGFPIAIAALMKASPDADDEWLSLPRRVAVLNVACDGLTALGLVALALALGLGARAAMVAGAIFALWPLAFWFTPFVLTEPIATSLGVWALVAALRIDRAWLAPLVAGLLAGAGALVRVDVLAVVPGLVLVAWLRAPRRRVVAFATLVAIGAALPIAPWALRNQRTFGAVHLAGADWVDRYGKPMPGCIVDWFRTWCRGDPYDGEIAGSLYWQTLDAAAHVYPVMSDSPEELAEAKALVEAAAADPVRMAESAPGFCALARRRAAAHPLRTWLALPALRARQLFKLPKEAEWPLGIFTRQGRVVRRALEAVNAACWIGALAALLAAAWIRRGPARFVACLGAAVLARLVLHAYAVPQFVGPRFATEAAPLCALAIACLPALLRARRARGGGAASPPGSPTG